MKPLIILMYHRIAEPPANVRIRGLYVTPRQFHRQIAWLRKHQVRFLTFTDLAHCTSQATHSGRGVDLIITFDDGHLDNYTHAYPILRHHGVPAVIYPVMGDLGKHGITWPESTDQHPVHMLSASQIREMSQNGIEFGSHLMHHTHLTGRPADEQLWELKTSKAKLEDITQKPAISVAYPYGDHDETVLCLARKAGYGYGVTTVPGIAHPAENPLALNRQAVKGSKFYHPLKFRRKLTRLMKRLPT